MDRLQLVESDGMVVVGGGGRVGASVGLYMYMRYGTYASAFGADSDGAATARDWGSCRGGRSGSIGFI